MNRSTGLVLIAIAAIAYGVYRALYLPALLVGPADPLLLAGFVVQAVAGIAAGIGVWRGARWAPLVLVVLGLSIAATAFVEAFVLGIIAYLRALLEVVVALAVTGVAALYVQGRFVPPSRLDVRGPR